MSKILAAGRVELATQQDHHELKFLLIQLFERLDQIEEKLLFRLAHGDSMDKQSFFSASEFARMIGVDRSTVTRWQKLGKVKFVKQAGTVLIPVSEIQRLKDKSSEV